jgi:hypothetical protein
MAGGPAQWCRIAGVVVAAGLFSVACGSGSTSSPGGASPSHNPTAPASSSLIPVPALCQDAEALHASVQKLTHVRIGKGTADEIKSDVADVKAKLDAFIASAHGQARAQTSAVKAALGTLEKAVSDLVAHPSISTVAATATALAGLSSAVGTLLTSLGPECPA